MRLIGIVLNCVISMIFLMLLNNCASTGLDPLRKEMNNYGYTLYEPPRTNWGPGWAFQLVKTYDGRISPVSVCENIYPDVTITDGELKLPNINKNTTVDLGVAIDFLEGLIKDSASAKANLKNISNVTISWGKVLSKEIPKEKQFTETGKVRKISPQCYSALLDLNEKKALEGKVFVIQRAALATGAKYTFNRKTDAKIEANIDWKKKLTFKPNVKIHRESDYSLIIDEARYIGFIAVAIEKWLPERAFTGPSATVKAFFIPVIKMESLLR